MTYLYEYPLDQLPARDGLEARAQALGEAWEHLQIVIVDPRSSHPRIAIPVKWSTAVRDITLAPNLADVSDIMTHELARFSALISTDDAPQWQVSRLVLADQSLGYVAVTISHVLADGTGGMRLAETLLSSTAFSPEPGLAPRMEDYVSTWPRASFALRMAWEELFWKPALNCVPAPISDRLRAEPWPGTHVDAPLERQSRSTVIDLLPAAELAALKAVCKAHDIDTLHPVIQTAFTTALWIIAGRPTQPFKCLVPKRMRGDETTYATGVSITAPLITTQHHDAQDFMHEARRVAGLLKDPTVLRDGEALMRMINFIGKEPSRWGRAEGYCSGLVEHYYTNTLPYAFSLSVSNLGKTTLPAGCSDMVWGQTSFALEVPLAASLIGHEGGLRMSLAYRDGSVQCPDGGFSAGHAEDVCRLTREILYTVLG